MEDVSHALIEFAKIRNEDNNYVPSNLLEIITNVHFVNVVIQYLQEDINLQMYNFIYELLLMFVIEHPKYFNPENYGKIILSYISFIQLHKDDIVPAAEAGNQDALDLIEKTTNIISQLLFYGAMRYNYFSDFPAVLKEKLSFQNQNNIVFHLGIIAQFAKLMNNYYLSEEFTDIPLAIRKTKPIFIMINHTMLEATTQTNFEYKSMYGVIISEFYQSLLHFHPLAKKIFNSFNDISSVVFDVFSGFVFEDTNYLDIFFDIFSLNLTKKTDPASYAPFFKFFVKTLSNAELIYSDEEFFFKYTALLHDFCESTRFVDFYPELIASFLKSLQVFTQYIDQVTDPRAIIILTKIWTYFPKYSYSKVLCLEVINLIENTLNDDSDFCNQIGVYGNGSSELLGYLPKLFDGYDPEVCDIITRDIDEKIEIIENQMIALNERKTASQILAFKLELIITLIKKNMHESIPSELMNLIYKIIDINTDIIYSNKLIILDHAISIAINFITSTKFRTNARKSGMNFIKICGIVFPRVEAALENVTDILCLPNYIDAASHLKPHPYFETFALEFLESTHDNLLTITSIVPMIELIKDVISVIWKDNQMLSDFSQIIDKSISSMSDNKVLLLLILIGMANYCKIKKDFVKFVQWLLDEKMDTIMSFHDEIEQELVLLLIIEILSKAPEISENWKLDKGMNLRPPILRNKSVGIEQMVREDSKLFIKFVDNVIPYSFRLASDIGEVEDPQRLSILIFDFFSAVWEYIHIIEFYKDSNVGLQIFRSFEIIINGITYENIYNNPNMLTSFLRLAPIMASFNFPTESRKIFIDLFDYIISNSDKNPELIYTASSILNAYINHQNGALSDLRNFENLVWKELITSDLISSSVLSDMLILFIERGSMMFLPIIKSYEKIPSLTKVSYDFVKGLVFEIKTIIKKGNYREMHHFFAKLRDFSLEYNLSFNSVLSSK